MARRTTRPEPRGGREVGGWVGGEASRPGVGGARRVPHASAAVPAPVPAKRTRFPSSRVSLTTDPILARADAYLARIGPGPRRGGTIPRGPLRPARPLSAG